MRLLQAIGTLWFCLLSIVMIFAAAVSFVVFILGWSYGSGQEILAGMLGIGIYGYGSARYFVRFVDRMESIKRVEGDDGEED